MTAEQEKNSNEALFALEKQREKGKLTEDEFAAKKKDLLNGWNARHHTLEPEDFANMIEPSPEKRQILKSINVNSAKGFLISLIQKLAGNDGVRENGGQLARRGAEQLSPEFIRQGASSAAVLAVNALFGAIDEATTGKTKNFEDRKQFKGWLERSEDPAIREKAARFIYAHYKSLPDEKRFDIKRQFMAGMNKPSLVNWGELFKTILRQPITEENQKWLDPQNDPVETGDINSKKSVPLEQPIRRSEGEQLRRPGQIVKNNRKG